MNIEKKIEDINEILLDKKNEIICKINKKLDGLDKNKISFLSTLVNENEIENWEKMENEERKKIVYEYCQNIENFETEYKAPKQNNNNSSYYIISGAIFFFSLLVKFSV